MATETKVQARDFKALLTGLRRYRLEQDFTYRELADRIGLAHSKVFRLLNDARPSVNDRTRYRIESFAERVGVTEKSA